MTEDQCSNSLTAPAEMEDCECVRDRPEALFDGSHHYCPGCTHGIYHRLVAEMIDEFHLLETTIGICPVGCSVLAYNYFMCDMIEASHGRAPAVATGVKRSLPESFVFTYQGDGDLASIGMGETVHAAARGENITVFFVNNGIYGMTGGQMAPTTLIGQKTTTSPEGREQKHTGFPIDVCALLQSLPGVAYLARVPLTSPKNLNKARKFMRKAVQAQLDRRGFSMVEALGTCPVQWHMQPREAMRYVDEVVVPQFPLGEIVDRTSNDASSESGKR